MYLRNLSTRPAGVVLRAMEAQLLSENPGTLWLDHPSHLYLTDRQAEAYLSLMADRKYSGNFHQPLKELLRANARVILEGMPVLFLLLDLGPGFPDKTFPLLEAIRGSRLDCIYAPVDINKRFLEVAEDAVSPYGFPVRPMNCLFEDLDYELEQLGGGESSLPRMVILGLTFMNYRPEDLFSFIRRVLRPQDRLLLATEILDSVPLDAITTPYQSLEAKRFTFAVLELIGLAEEVVEYDVRFVDGRIEMGFILLRDIAVGGRHLRKGTRLVTAISYRYYLDEFREVLSAHFPHCRLFLDDLAKTALGMVTVNGGTEDGSFNHL